MGAVAVTVPLASTVGLAGLAGAATPQNPISCKGLNGTVTFPGPITTEGQAVAAKTGGATTITSGSFTCGSVSASIASNPLTVPGGKNGKLSKTDSRYNKTTGVKYLTNSWATFQAASGSLKKTLKDINFTVNGSPVLFKIKSSSAGTCADGNVGFQLNGQVKAGTYADKTASITACLGADTRHDGSHGSFGSDVLSDNGGGVVSASIDSGATGSVATL